MAEGTKKITEAEAKMILAIFLVLIVAPAWGMYILPKTLALEEQLEQELEGGEEAEELEKLEEKAKGAEAEAGKNVPSPAPPATGARPATPSEPPKVVGQDAPAPQQIGAVDN